MKIVTNEPIIKRNARLSQVILIGGLIVLIAGFVVSLKRPELVMLSFLCLIVGFFLSQIGISFVNRWGRSPRPDQLLNQALKGLDDKYAIYHHILGTHHLLIGPAGVWILLPKYHKGTISFLNGRWKQSGGGFMYQYLKLFGQEGLGRPDLEVRHEIEITQKSLSKKIDESQIPPIQVALVFVNDTVELKIDENITSPAASLYLSKLKEFIRKSAKSKPISLDKSEEMQRLLPNEV